MTFSEFENSIFDDIVPNRNEHLRSGQSVMGYLYSIWPAEYYRLVNRELEGWKDGYDCFYVDRRIPALLNHLKNKWHEYPE